MRVDATSARPVDGLNVDKTRISYEYSGGFMLNNDKRLKAFLLSTILLISAAFLFMQFNIYTYIDTKLSEFEVQLDGFDNRLDSAEKNFRKYRIEIKGFETGLSNVERDMDSLKARVRNATSNHNGLPITSNNRSYVGKLIIPDVGIDLSLYSGWAQDITDRQDSANYFTFSRNNHNNMIIADHKTQEFSKLYDVKVGTIGRIEFKDGCVEEIKCVKVLDGHNKLTRITDLEGKSLLEEEDYLMYTCKNGWWNIIICLWTII